MKVKLISFTDRPELVVASAAKQCYSADTTENIIEKLSIEDARKFIEGIVKVGHDSVLEHASFSFAISNVSRTCTHELVRHRIAAHSQQSQRYVQENIQFEYVMPKTIKSEESKKAFTDLMEQCQNTYATLVADGIPAEDARFVLPNAKTANITISMNARALRNFFSLRMCGRAQWEIRELAGIMLQQCEKVAPSLFYLAGPHCLKEGKCPEGKRTCGRVYYNERLKKHQLKLEGHDKYIGDTMVREFGYRESKNKCPYCYSTKLDSFSGHNDTGYKCKVCEASYSI